MLKCSNLIYTNIHKRSEKHDIQKICNNIFIIIIDSGMTGLLRATTLEKRWLKGTVTRVRVHYNEQDDHVVNLQQKKNSRNSYNMGQH